MSSDRATSQLLLSAATGTGAGTVNARTSKNKTVQARGATTNGTGAATIYIQGTNFSNAATATDWETICTLSLTLGTTVTQTSQVIEANWLFVRANVNAISGTGASVDVAVGST